MPLMPEPRPTISVRLWNLTRELYLKLTEESASNEHAHVTRSRLESSSQSYDQTADENGLLSSYPVGKIRCDRQRYNGADRLNGIEQALFRAGWITEVWALLERKIDW